ncbi:MAG: hypothetical protein ACOZEN_10375 [Thermodesulfobacteriota bacterium]
MTAAEDLRFRAFDPPHLGIPAGARFSGKASGGEGRFVELFLHVERGTVLDAGFLTDIPGGEGVLCASFWCEAATGADIEKARSLTEADLLACFPPGFPPPLEAARLCVEAGRMALEKTRDQ